MSQHAVHSAANTEHGTPPSPLPALLPEPTPGALQSQQQARATPNQQTHLKPAGRSFTETPRGTNFTQRRIQSWNSLPLGPNGLTGGDQTNSHKEIPAQAPEHEDQILICSQEGSKPQLEAEPASWGQHPAAAAGCCCSFHSSFPQTG